MEKKSTIPERRIPCEFCNEEIAILYCRADSAKLCLFCDFHVHSANDLSRKHVRSQICDNCSSQPVSVRCGTDNLVLCQDCDWDSHGNCSVSANHERNPVEGFSGCPTPMELASIWGFDLGEKKAALPISPVMQENNGGFENWSSIDSLLGFDNWGDGGGYKHGEMSLQDLMVPNECANVNLVPCAEIPAPSKWQNPSCGKHKQVIFKQLIELVKRDQIRGGGDGDGDGDGGDAGGGSGGEDLGPETPSRSAKQGSNEEGLDLQNGVQGVVDSNQVLPRQAPFTQLLMSTNLRGNNDLIVEEDALWGCNPPSNESRQIWDFNLGKSRDHEPPNQLEVGYDTTDTGFMMQSYSDLINGTPMVPTKMLEDTYELKCSSTNKESESANRNSKRAKTSEANNLTIQPSSSSSLAKGVSNVQDVHLLEQSLLVISETTDATTRANMELLAQNRGNAMLRYKEKKKTRRYDKHIRYESRKARADTRKRVKGRFVKASEAPDVKITG